MKIVGTPSDPLALGSLEPTEVLYEFDRPLFYSAVDPLGATLLVYECDFDEEGRVLLVVPSSRRVIGELAEGRTSMLDALLQPWGWLARFSDGKIASATRVDPAEDMTPESLPSPGTMAAPGLEPLIGVRSIGPDITKGSIPPSVIRNSIGAAVDAVRGIAQYVAFEMSEDHRAAVASVAELFNLRTQRMGYGSFEVALSGIPARGQMQLFERAATDGKTLSEIQRLLTTAIRVASKPNRQDNAAKEFGSEEQAKMALDAIKELTPATAGEVVETRVSGQLIVGPRASYRLTRESREYVNFYTGGSVAESLDQFETLSGRLRGWDLDKRLSVLREIPGRRGEQRLTYEESMQPLVREYTTQEIIVTVRAKRLIGRPWKMVDLKPGFSLP
jgi:hypothetical protein